jgi:hypothetical protein
MKKIILSVLMMFMSLVTLSSQASTNGCPSGWVQSADKTTCVQTIIKNTTANNTDDTTRPICINGYYYNSSINQCQKTASYNTQAANKIYTYLGGLSFGSDPHEQDMCLNYPGNQTSCPLGNSCDGGSCSCLYNRMATNDGTYRCAACSSYTSYTAQTGTCWGSYFIYNAYQLLFDRPPEFDGYSYWYSLLNGASRYYSTLTLYRSAQNGDFPTSRNKMWSIVGIEAIYNLMFNRAPASSELTYWQDEFSRLGILGDGEAMINKLYQSAQNSDIPTANSSIDIISTPPSFY